MKKENVWKLTVGVAAVLFVALIGGTILPVVHIGTAKEIENSFNVESLSNSSTVQNKQIVSKMIASKSVGELIEESNLVAICTYKEPSESFQVLYTNGGGSIYTDYYFEVNETFRGEAPEDGIVAVRQEGGTIGNDVLEVSPSCDFEVGKSYLLFLYHPSVGSGRNTEGNYYYIRGHIYGAYPIDASSLMRVNSTQVVNEIGSNPIEVGSFQQQVEFYNEKTPPTEDIVIQESIENMQENVRTGMMTQEEYDKAMDEMDEYATYVGDPPAGYSGK